MAYVVDSTGKVREVADDPTLQGFESGQTATPEQVAEYHRQAEMEAKYGGASGAALAGLSSAASALTFGLSDVLLAEAGDGNAETLRNLRETNPAASGVGTAIGIVAPAIATFGASTPVSAASVGVAGARGVAGAVLRRSAPALISRVGRAVEGAVARSLPAGETVAGQIAARAAAVGAGSAVEGAAYGLGNVVSEAALGDPNLTAQSAAAHVGISALLGGGFGLLLGGGQTAIPAAVRRTRESIGSTFTKAEERFKAVLSESESFTGTSKDTSRILWERKTDVAALDAAAPGAAKALDNSTPEIAEWVLNNRARLADMEKAFPGTTAQLARVEPKTADYLLDNWQKVITDPKARVEMAKDLTAGMQKVIDETNDLLRRVNKEMAPKEAAALLADADGAVVAARYTKLHDEIDAAITKMRAEPELFDGGYARNLEMLRDGLVRDASISATPVDVFKRLKTLRQTLDEAIPYEKDMLAVGVSGRNAINELKTLRRSVKATITDEAVFGGAAARQVALDDAMSEWLSLFKRGGDFNSKFMRKVTGKGGVSYVVKPTKLNTWLNQMADARGEDFSATWGRAIDAAKKIAAEAEASAKVAQVVDFDRKALDSLIEKAQKATADARERAAVTEVKNQLDPRMSWGSMPVASTPWRDLGVADAAKSVLPGPARAIVERFEAVKESTRSVSRTVQRLTVLERFSQQVSASIQKSVDTVVEGTARAATPVRGGAAAGAALAVGGGAADALGAFTKRTELINALAHNPDQLHETLTAQTEDLHEHAPATAEAMQVTSARAVAFLASKVPQRPQRGPLGAAWRPSAAEIAAFNRYYDAVERPADILNQAAAGTLTPEAVEAVATVYPELFATMRAALIDKIASKASNPKGDSIPYRTKMMLSLLLGSDVDGSTAPAMVKANQATLAGPSAKTPDSQQQTQTPAVRPTSKGIGEITLSSRLLTPSQGAGQRRF